MKVFQTSKILIHGITWGIVWFLQSTAVVHAEDNLGNKLAILETTDKSQFGLAPVLQEGLAKAAANTNLFQAYLANYSLSGFDEASIRADFKKVGADLMSYVYVENNRLSIFFFDSGHPKEFIMSYRDLRAQDGQNISGTEIENAFSQSFQEVISSYLAKEYQSLRGTPKENHQELAQNSVSDSNFSTTDVKRLYRELASISQTPLYIGANVGMSRFETIAANLTKTHASTVNIGGVLGYRLLSPISVEIGADIFTHFMIHSDLRGQIPLGSNFISISLSAGAARFMTQPTENLGYAGANQISQGTMVYGPGFGVEIPLLGLTIRAEARFYTGSTSVFLGTYGIVYSL
jgi:hypothetical protein